MISKFEAFNYNDQLTQEIKEYFEGIIDSGAEIDIRHLKSRAGLWRIGLEGSIEILQSDPELNFMSKFYDDSGLVISDIPYSMRKQKPSSEHLLVKNNPFFQRILKFSNLDLCYIYFYDMRDHGVGSPDRDREHYIPFRITIYLKDLEYIS